MGKKRKGRENRSVRRTREVKREREMAKTESILENELAGNANGNVNGNGNMTRNRSNNSLDGEMNGGEARQKRLLSSEGLFAIATRESNGNGVDEGEGFQRRMTRGDSEGSIRKSVSWVDSVGSGDESGSGSGSGEEKEVRQLYEWEANGNIAPCAPPSPAGGAIAFPLPEPRAENSGRHSN